MLAEKPFEKFRFWHQFAQIEIKMVKMSVIAEAMHILEENVFLKAIAVIDV